MPPKEAAEANEGLEKILAKLGGPPADDPNDPAAPGTIMSLFTADLGDGKTRDFFLVSGPNGLLFISRKITDFEKDVLKEDDANSPLVISINQHYSLAKGAKPGDRFLLSISKRFLCQLPSDLYEPTGPTVTVGEMLGGGYFLLEIPAGRSAGIGPPAIFVTEGEMKRLKIKTGDRVLLDQSGLRVLKVLPPPPKKDSTTDSLIVETTNVTWNDIGGLDHIRDWFIETFSDPYNHPELYKFYNLSLPKGALLSGPPGNGKSLLAKAFANSIAEKHGVPGGFIAINGPEVLNCFVGETEARIRRIFEAADEYYQKHNVPPVIFIDEAEALFSRRGSGRSADMEKTIVPTFLTSVDGMKGTKAFILLATNRPDQLDPAVIREGRIDRKLEVPRPTKESARSILEVHTKKFPKATDDIIDKTLEMIFNPSLVLASATTESGDVPVTFGDLTSGAMLAAICMEASRIAMKRDVALGRKIKPTGVGPDDLKEAVKSHIRSTASIDHEHSIKELLTSRGFKVKNITRKVLK